MSDDALRERYRILFEQAPVGVFIYDRALVIRECNARFAEILRSSVDRLIGLDMHELRDQTVVPTIARALEGFHATQEGPYSATTSDASIFVTLRCAPLRDAEGNVVGGMGVVEDVTERRRKEEQLTRSEAKLRTLLERAPDAIAVISHDREIVYANAALARLLGYDKAEDLIGLHDSIPIHPEDRSILEQRKPFMMENVPLPAQEYRMVRRDGSTVYVEVLTMPIDYDGKPASLSFARDLTERKLMQAKLLVAVRMASVGTLAAGVAHEINNPLAYVIANLDMIGQKRLPQLAARVEAAEDADLATRVAQIAEMVEIAREGADRVRSIVRDLRTFSRGDDEKRGPVDVRRVLDASINMAWNEIRHRARLVKEYESVPTIEANEARVGQVFLNLLVNAAQALPVGGASDNTIRVHAATSPRGEAIVEVTDSGPGIPADVIDRIFDPFFTTKPVGVGTGLGLWICEGIVTSLGGSISVESTPGRGATFRITLPPRSDESRARTPSTAPPASPPASAAEHRGRVLVVDDEPAIVRTLSAALMEEHDVVSMGSGREALDLLREGTRFDVVLCDLMMPDVTGMDLYERIEAEQPGMADRFVFMTGGAFTPRAREFLDGVRAPRIEKPFDVSKLLDLVRRHAARR